MKRWSPPLLALLSCLAGLRPLVGENRPLTLRDFRPPAGTWQEVAVASLHPEQRRTLAFTPGTGIITNGSTGQTTNLLTHAEFGDMEVHVEYLLADDSNSGVYLMGRYEVQIRDSHGIARPAHSDAGGLYQRWDPRRSPSGWEGSPPRVNAARPAGEWQTLDIVFRAPRFDSSGQKTEHARFVQVVHNGVVVQKDVAVTGPTRSATYEDERAHGPIMLQGDHGPVAFRNLRVRAVNLEPVAPSSGWQPLDLRRDFDRLLGDEVPGARLADVLEVVDGEIRGMYRWQAPGRTPSGLVVSKQRYSHFDVEFEINWGERSFEPRYGEAKNAGFLYHIQGTHPIWPPCLEAQGMQGNLGDHFSIRGVNGHQLTPEGQLVELPRYEFAHGPKRFSAEKPGWNRVRVEVRGDAASYFVNDELVNVIRQAVFGGLPCTDGFIGFQAEHAEVTYRNLRLRVVPAGGPR